MIQIEMKMPDKCSECRFQTDYGFCSAMPKNFCGATSDEGKPDWCPLKNAVGWISVKDRLPVRPPDVCGLIVRRQWYLVALESGTVLTLSYEFDDDRWEGLGYPVTHWMPRPEPPKEGEVG